MKKLPLLLATLLTAAVVMAGCSKKEDQSAAPASGSGSAMQSAPAISGAASDAAAHAMSAASDAGAAAPAPASN